VNLPLAILVVVAPATAAAGAPSAPARPADGGAAFAADLAAARSAFARRDDPARLSEAVALFAKAAALRPGDARAEIPLARAQAFRAQSRPDEALDAWREAAAAAERALRAAAPAWAEATDRGQDPARTVALVRSTGAEALYWFALATMGSAQARGMIAVLAVRDAARAMMERAAELDERVDHGGPRRALGAWLAALPSAAGGGPGAAREEFERARALAPSYQLARVREAETLAVLLQDRQRFEALLKAVLAFDASAAPEIGPENRLAKRLARDLLARRDTLFSP
jgi:hypothetical protein